MKIVLIIMIFLTTLLADREGGPYVGVGYGVSQYNDDGLYEKLKNDRSESVVLYAGAYINRYLSVELASTSFDVWHVQDGYEIDDDYATNFSAITVSTMAHYAFFDDILDFYAKFGVGEVSASGINANGFTMLWGGGVGVRFTELLSMRIAYDRYIFDYSDSSGSYNMHIDYIYSSIEFQF